MLQNILEHKSYTTKNLYDLLTYLSRRGGDNISSARNEKAQEKKLAPILNTLMDYTISETWPREVKMRIRSKQNMKLQAHNVHHSHNQQAYYVYPRVLHLLELVV